MKKVKKLVIKLIVACTRFLNNTRFSSLIGEIIIKDVMQKVQTVEHNNIKMEFSVPNKLNHFRVNTFSSKEPETLEWIDSLPKESIFWDIGANIGLYSVYAAKRKNCIVFAFEPSVFNLEFLARNISLNDMQENVTIIPIAMDDKMGSNKLRLTTTVWGGALSAFGKNSGWDGKPIKDIFSFKTFGCSMDKAVSTLKLPQPDYIKMDVDGIEHYILGGGKRVLENTRGILIEVNDDYREQTEKTKYYLSSAGLVFEKKLHSEMVENQVAAGYSNTYNQIWIRK